MICLGIDMGTSGCRLIAIDDGGAEVARETVALAPPHRDGACVEQDAEVWWEALGTVLRAVVRKLPEPPAGLAIDGTSGTLVVTDDRGHPLGTALLYNDARAQAQAQRIAGLAPRESGAHGPTSSLAKLLWWLGYRDAGRARHALHQADWLAGRLTERWGLSDENNALKMGYDPASRAWPAWMDALELPAGLLPRVVAPGDLLGHVTPGAAEACGIPEGLPVFAGTTDSVAGFLATGAALPGEAVTSLGSTLVLKIVSPEPVFAPEYGVYSHRIGDRWVAGGASNSGGAALLQFFTPEQMRALTPTLDPDRPTGLDYYPLPAPGERFPHCDPGFTPRLEPRPDDDATFFQGLLEGIAAIEAEGYRLLAKLGAPGPRSIRTVGGGAANPAWRRIRERTLPAPLVEADHSEAAYGAALLARQGARRSRT